MSDQNKIIEYLEHIVDIVATLFKDSPILAYTLLFILIVAPILIREDPERLTKPLAILSAVALAGILIYLYRCHLELMQKHQDVVGISSTDDALRKWFWFAVTTTSPAKSKDNAESVILNNLSDFWDKELEGKLVTVNGTLSVYAPYVIGPHKLKRDRHLEYRKSLEEREEKGLPTMPSANAILAYTAGQMVWKPEFEASDDSATVQYQYLGLYESIVRNSVPVFIDKTYFDQIKQSLFDDRGTAIQVLITGEVRKLPVSFDDVINQFNVSDIRPEINIWHNSTALGLYVSENGIDMQHTAPPRYLDGDIWVAVMDNDKEQFRSRFLNLADPQDIATNLQDLRSEVKDLQVTHAFDSRLWERL